MAKEKKEKVVTKDENRVRLIVGWCLFGLIVTATVLFYVFQNDISNGIREHAPNISNGTVLYIWSNILPSCLKTIQIIAIAIGLAVALHYLAKITFHTKKGKTVSKLIVNFLKWVIAIATVFFVLAAWGANTTMMLASAGVFTLIIGLGSQALVADILAGIFIVFEGDFQVGDIVIIDGWRGEVKAIGIRTTKLVDAGGNIKIVNNSDIRSIINQTKELSVAKCSVGISYGDRIERVEKIIADNLPKIKEKIPAIVEGPFYKGVAELGDSAVTLLFVATCKESDIYQVQRDLNREIKIVFDDNNVNIPFPQVTVSYDNSSEPAKVTKKVKKQAEDFVGEQKALSEDVDDHQNN